ADVVVLERRQDVPAEEAVGAGDEHLHSVAPSPSSSSPIGGPSRKDWLNFTSRSRSLVLITPVTNSFTSGVYACSMILSIMSGDVFTTQSAFPPVGLPRVTCAAPSAADTVHFRSSVSPSEKYQLFRSVISLFFARV